MLVVVKVLVEAVTLAGVANRLGFRNFEGLHRRWGWQGRSACRGAVCCGRKCQKAGWHHDAGSMYWRRPAALFPPVGKALGVVCHGFLRLVQVDLQLK